MRVRILLNGVRILLSASVCFAIAASANANGVKSAASSATAAASKTPIKIGIIAPLTSPIATGVAPETLAGAQARVKFINANGGINGRKLDLISCNDNLNPNTAIACANTELSDGVVALIGVQGPEMAGIYPILQTAGVASIGALPVNPAIGDSPVATCFTASDGVFAAMPFALKNSGHANTLSLIYPNNLGAASSEIVVAFQKGVAAAGAKVGVIAGYPINTTEFGPVVAQALASGVTGVVAMSTGAPEGPLIAAIQSQNPKVKIAIPGFAWRPTVQSYLGNKANGIYVATNGEPSTASVPGIRLFNRDMSRYEFGYSRDDTAIDSWASVWAFQQMTTGLKGGISRKAVLRAFSKFKNLSFDGIYPAMSKGYGHTFTALPNHTCVSNATNVLSVIKHEKLAPLNNGAFINPFA